MTKTCTSCGVTVEGVGQVLKVFAKDSNYKFGISSRCARCNRAGTTGGSIQGEYCLLSERPQPIKTCECCGLTVDTKQEMAENFRAVRAVTYAAGYTSICKGCEEVACMVLSEFTHVIRDGGEILKGGEDYLQLLTDIYLVLGYRTVPTDSLGKPMDVLQFPMRYTMPDGVPFAKSSKRIWQIKIEAGYLIPEEEDFE